MILRCHREEYWDEWLTRIELPERKYQLEGTNFVFSDNSALIIGNGGRVYDAVSGTLVFETPLTGLHSFTLSPDLRRAAAVDFTGVVHVYDFPEGTETHRLELPADERLEIAFGAGGTTLFVNGTRYEPNEDFEKLIWNLNDPQTNVQLGDNSNAYLILPQHNDNFPYIGYLPSVEANMMYLFMAHDNVRTRVEYWELFPSRMLFQIDEQYLDPVPQYSATGRALLYGGTYLWGGEVRFFSINTGELLASTGKQNQLLSPGNRWLYDRAPAGGATWFWGVASDPTMLTLPLPTPIATFTPTQTWTPLPPGVIPTITPTLTVTPTQTFASS